MPQTKRHRWKNWNGLVCSDCGEERSVVRRYWRVHKIKLVCKPVKYTIAQVEEHFNAKD